MESSVCESMSTPLSAAVDASLSCMDRAFDVVTRDEVCSADAPPLLAAVRGDKTAASGVLVMFGVCAVVATERHDAVSFDRAAVSRAMNVDPLDTTFVACGVMFDTSNPLVLLSSVMDDSFPSNEGREDGAAISVELSTVDD
jgi:hypothetical protein